MSAPAQEQLIIQERDEDQPLYSNKSTLSTLCLCGGGILFGIIGVSIIYAIIFHDAAFAQCNPDNSLSSCNCPDIKVFIPNLGIINGLNKNNKTYEFLGIPYALPPTGNRRWSNPQPYNIPFPQEGYPATFFRPSCYQNGDGTTQPNGIAEDCLYLNIFVSINGFSNKHNKKLPVLVWTYGGGNLYGGSSQSVPALYNGTNLILSANNYINSQDVIVVTLNYRLDVFSSLYLQELNMEDKMYGTSGEYANLDVQLAYKWVQKYIYLFNGDSNKVLGFGQSSGANMASIQTIMKGSEGLLSAVVHQSGSFGLPFAFASLNQTKTASRRFVTLAGCDGLNSTETLTCLRKLPAPTVLTVAGQVGTGFNALRTGIDGVLIPSDPQQLLLEGKVTNRVPWLWGYNTQDAFTHNCDDVPPDTVVTEALYNGSMIANFGGNLGLNLTSINRILAKYPFSSCYVPNNQSLTLQQCCNFVQITPMDYVWKCQARRMLNLQYNYSKKLFLYEFGQYPTCPFSYNQSLHGDEIPYIFGTISHAKSTGLEPSCNWSSTEREFSQQVTSSWISFLTQINPSIPNLPAWKNYIPKTQESGYFLQELNLYPFSFTTEEINDCDTFWEPLLWDMYQWFINGGEPELYPAMDQTILFQQQRHHQEIFFHL